MHSSAPLNAYRFRYMTHLPTMYQNSRQSRPFPT
nr:MAG TPA: hypothetical protein [Caudoviricetes sp.]